MITQVYTRHVCPWPTGQRNTALNYKPLLFQVYFPVVDLIGDTLSVLTCRLRYKEAVVSCGQQTSPSGHRTSSGTVLGADDLGPWCSWPWPGNRWYCRQRWDLNWRQVRWEGRVVYPLWYQVRVIDLNQWGMTFTLVWSCWWGVHDDLVQFKLGQASLSHVYCKARSTRDSSWILSTLTWCESREQ